MKKISIAFIILLLVVGISFNFYGGNANDIGGDTAGTSKEVYVINDNENYHNAGVRLQTRGQSDRVYRDWLIYNQGNTGKLSFGFWDGTSHSNSDENDYEKVPMVLTSSGYLTLLSGATLNDDLSFEAGQGRGIRFWDEDRYGMTMGNDATHYRYGPVTDYSIRMNMNNNSSRGWTWGVADNGGGKYAPIAALNTQGNMKIKGYLESESYLLGTSFLTKVKNNGTADYVGMKADGGSLLVGSDGYIRFQETDANVTRVVFDMNNNKVGINVADDQLDATLKVGGTITATGNITAPNVIVGVTSFPDYVFADDYNLLSLEALKAYIDEHKHLPNIPAASEIEKGGMDLGKINVLLTEKIEELTLYTIEQDEKLKKQDEKLMQQDADLKSMKKELEMLKTMILTKKAVK